MGSDNNGEGQALSHPYYWDSHYAKAKGQQPTHEWLKSFTALGPLFTSHLFYRDAFSRILHLGSGDSTIPYDLVKRGYVNQVCVDFSPTVVNLMAARRQNGIEWIEGDVRDLIDMPDQSVDVAFDKSTLDAMIYGSPWNPPHQVKENATKYMDAVFRVLKDDGVFLCVSFRQPHFIKPLVNCNRMWNLDVEVLRENDTAFDYYAFVMTKSNPSESPPQ